MNNLSISEALRLGVEAHKAGNVSEADRYYTAILQTDPNHPDANHNMGVLAAGLNKIELALPFFRKALDLNPDKAQFWVSLIAATIKLENFDDARELLVQATRNSLKGEYLAQLEEMLTSARSRTHQFDINRVDEIDKNIDENKVTKLDTVKLDQAIRLAAKKLKTGDFEGAKNIYKEIILKFPNNNKALRGLETIAAKLSKTHQKLQQPTDDQLRELAVLYNQGHKNEPLRKAIDLLRKYPQSAFLHNLCGVIYADDEKYEVAIESYNKSLQLNPYYPEAYNNKGNALRNTGKLEAAVENYNQAIKFQSDYTEAYYNLGTVLEDEERFEAALKSYNTALKLKPYYVKVYFAKGNLFISKRQLYPAIKSFKQALIVDPTYYQAYHNMGNGQKKANKPDAALESYRRALRVKPNLAEAHLGLGSILYQKGKVEAALNSCIQALKLNPEFDTVYYQLGKIFSKIDFVEARPDLYPILEKLLTGGHFVSPVSVSSSVLNLIKTEAKIQSLFDFLYPIEIVSDFYNILDILADCSLLQILLKLCPTASLEFEKLFSEVRKFLLLNNENLELEYKQLKLIESLALQCFINEFVYFESDEEIKCISQLEKKVRELLEKGGEPNLLDFLCLGCYRPLYQYDWCSKINLDAQFFEFEKRVITEPQTEEKLICNIQLLDTISNNVSLEVRQQYEENPYPRWISSEYAPKPMSIGTKLFHMGVKISSGHLDNIQSPELLVAGCGTGRQVIELATSIRNCQITAVDLSLSSIAYAKRKTDESMIKHIEYLQADILDLKGLGRSFDLIESLGVLHHMEDPLAGWNTLVDILRPNGLIRIGLYSELARQSVVRCRQLIESMKLEGNASDIRMLRNMIINSDDLDLRQLFHFWDFFSLSEFRDLVFHVREHRFTIPKIQETLEYLGLGFCGFGNEKLHSLFTEKYKGKDDLYDLNKWHEFETQNPTAFLGMYQFYCQKLR